MSRSRLILVVALVVVGGAIAAYYLRSGREHVSIDLIRDFPTATEKKPNPEAFSIVDAKIGGVTKKGIFTKDLAGTRVIWEETIPDNAWLKVDLGIMEEGWTLAGDGVVFNVGISVGATYDALLSLPVNPYGNPADRRWNPLEFDLSAYAGQTVHIVFKTNSSGPGKDDRNGDLAVWGEPRIVIH
jgi:hypothetical protein